MKNKNRTLSPAARLADWIIVMFIIAILSLAFASLSGCAYVKEVSRNCNVEAQTLNDTTRACIVCKGLKQSTLDAIQTIGKSAQNAK